MTGPSLSAVACLLAVAGCAAPGGSAARSASTPKPLAAHEWFAIDYHGQVGIAEGLSEPETVPAPAPVGAAAGMKPLLVSASLWRVDGATARALLQDGARQLDEQAREGCFAIGARVVAADVEKVLHELVDGGRAVVVHEPRFNCDPGRLTTASVVQSAAFVRGYELLSRPSAMVVDPIVDTSRSGVVWSIHCDRTVEHSIEVRVGLTTVEDCGEMQALRGRLLRGGEFALQTPLQCRQSVSARATLTDRDGLLLTGMCAADQDAQFIALLTAVEPDAVASPTSRR